MTGTRRQDERIVDMTGRFSPAGGDSDPVAAPRGRRRRPRWRRWLVGIALGLVGLVSVALLLLQVSSISTRVVNAVLARVHAGRSTLHADHVDGNWLASIEVHGFRMTRGDTVVVAVDTLRVRYSLASLLARRLVVHDLGIAGVVVSAYPTATKQLPAATPSPRFAPADLLRGRFYKGRAVQVDRVALRDARFDAVSSEPTSALRVERIRLLAHDIHLGGELAFELDSLQARALRPAQEHQWVEVELGAAVRDGQLETRLLRLRSDTSRVEAHATLAAGASDSLAAATIALHAHPFQLRDLDFLAPALGLEGAVDVDIETRGVRPDRLTGTVAMTFERAHAGAVDLGPSRLNATLADGRADMKLSTQYEGARADVAGWIRPLDTVPRYGLDARIDRLPRRLPGAPWWPAFAARAGAAVTLGLQGAGYAHPVVNVAGRLDGDAGRVDFDARADATNGLEWDVRRLAFERLDVARLAGQPVTSDFNGTLTATGRQAGASTPRLEARFELSESSWDDRRIESATARARMNGADLAAALRLETDAGGVEIDSLSGRWDKTGFFAVRGARFHDIDLGRLLNRESVASRLDGSFRGEARGLAHLSQGTPALRDGRVSARLDIEIGASRVRQQEISQGSARIALEHGGVDLTARLATPASRIDVGARARPFDTPLSCSVDDARFDHVDLEPWSGNVALRSNLSGSLRGAARARSEAEPGGHWNAALHLDRSQIAGVTLGGGDADVSCSGRQAEVAAAVRVAADSVALRGEVALRDSVPEGRVDVSFPFGAMAALMRLDSLATRGGVEAHVSFTGLSPATATVNSTFSGRGAVDTAQLDSLFAQVRLQGGVVALDTLTARSNIGVATASGRVALFDSTATSDLHFGLAVRDASPLRAVLRSDTLDVGDCKLDFHLAGPAAARRFDASGSLRALVWNDIRLLEANASAHGSLDRAWRPNRATVDVALSRLAGVPVPVTTATAHAALDDGKSEFDLVSSLDDRHRLHLAGGAQSDSAGAHVRLATLDVQADSSAWALTQPALLHLGKDRVAVEHFDLRSSTGHVAANGVIDRKGDQDFRLDLRGVGLGTVSELLGRANTSGTLSGSLALQGPASAPHGSGNFQVDLYAEHQPAGAVRSRLQWDGSRLDLGGRFETPAGDSLTWSTHLPLSLARAGADSSVVVAAGRGAGDIRIAATRFPLHELSPFLDPHRVGALEGMLDMDVAVGLSGRKLRANGRLDVTNAVLPLPGLGVTYKDIALQMVFADSTLTLQRAQAVSDKGRLEATGDVRLPTVARIEPRLHVTANRFTFVRTPDLRLIASGAVDLNGSLAAPIAKGKLTLENCSFNLKPSAGSSGGPAVQLSPADVRMMEETFGYVSESGNDRVAQMYDASDLDLDIAIQRNNWLRQQAQPTLSVALTGQVHFRKAPHGEPEMFGRIEPIPGRGYVEELARDFDIAGGAVLLNGKMKDHRVDIQAQYKPPSSSESSQSPVVVNLDVAGSVDDLKLKLTSVPPMSEVEILSYIATGHSPYDTATTASASDTRSLAMDVGLAQATSGAERAAQQAIGLDVLQVRFDALQGATLVAGRYLFPDLYVGFRQPLQYKDTGSPSAGVTYRNSVEVEYALYRWLILDLQGESTSLRSFLRARHEY